MGLSDEERDLLRDWWDEDTTVGVESAFPIISRLIDRHVTAALNAAADEIDRTCRDWEPWTDGRNRTPEVRGAVAAFEEVALNLRAAAQPPP